MNVYIAAPFFKPEQLTCLTFIEQTLKRAVIDFYSPRSEGVLVDMTPEEREERMSYLFQQNIKHLNLCTHVLAIIDDYDTGTVWEMGYAYAMGKKIVTYTDYYHGINVMLNESIIAHCQKFEEIIPALMGHTTTTKGSDVI